MEHSKQHAINTAKIFNQLKSKVVSVTSLTMFPGTELADEEKEGKFTELTEKQRMKELKLFLEELNVDTEIWTHHTSTMMIAGKFPEKKSEMLEQLQYGIDHMNEDEMAKWRRSIHIL